MFIRGLWYGCGTVSIGLGYGPIGGPCEHSNEPLGSIIGEFLEHLSKMNVLIPATWN